MSQKNAAPSPRTRVKRVHERGAYDRTTIDAILDASPIAHVGYIFEDAPFVTPTLHWREGDHVYWHGSAASRMIETADGAEVCLTVTLLDGLVLARSAFHHSANYRSVMLFGRATLISDPEAKEARLKAFMEGLVPGRWETLRPILQKELKATSILSMPIIEASAKVRTGPPKDDEPDYALDIWAGTLPLQISTGAPVDDPRLKPGLCVPEAVRGVKIG
ncbi:MAG: pyridoxamine 5'-phosphate oxidase family protein [Alphaproteobacteria bacterium]|nr:pyridoxamine 5'-phosphate oxidase family protein [Alphaproteobacteria bacterium]MDE2340156.1 pyridoxamine 5'-phosphate oxidase family protein [Alphaproteobacteria bacterium]